jgi:hypothetical protein
MEMGLVGLYGKRAMPIMNQNEEPARLEHSVTTACEPRQEDKGNLAKVVWKSKYSMF